MSPDEQQFRADTKRIAELQAVVTYLLSAEHDEHCLYLVERCHCDCHLSKDGVRQAIEAAVNTKETT